MIDKSTVKSPCEKVKLKHKIYMILVKSYFNACIERIFIQKMGNAWYEEAMHAFHITPESLPSFRICI